MTQTDQLLSQMQQMQQEMRAMSRPVKGKKKRMNRKKRLATGVALMLLLLLTGTFAWMSGTQRAINPLYGAPTYGGRIHDNFRPERNPNGGGMFTGEHNKDVFAENFENRNLMVRIRLFEYLAFDSGEDRRTVGSAAADVSDPETWNLFTVDGDFNRIGYSAAIGAYADPDRDFLGFGGQKVFMPTFNHAVQQADFIDPSINPLFGHRQAYLMTEATGEALDWFSGLPTPPITRQVLVDFEAEPILNADDEVEGFTVEVEVTDNYSDVPVVEYQASVILEDPLGEDNLVATGGIEADVTDASYIVVRLPGVNWYYAVAQNNTTDVFRVFAAYGATPTVDTAEYTVVRTGVFVREATIVPRDTINHASDFFRYGTQTGPGTDPAQHEVVHGDEDFWTVGEAMDSNLIYTQFNQNTNMMELRTRPATHVAQETLAPEITYPVIPDADVEAVLGGEFLGVMTLDQWNTLGNPSGNFWIFDNTDGNGWFYWNGYLAPGTATSLLLDYIYIPNTEHFHGYWEYLLHVEGEFISRDCLERDLDWGDLNSSAPISDDALTIFGFSGDESQSSRTTPIAQATQFPPAPVTPPADDEETPTP